MRKLDSIARLQQRLRQRAVCRRCSRSREFSVDGSIQGEVTPKTSRTSSSDLKMQREWLDNAARSLRVQELSGWYKIAPDQVLRLDGSAFIKIQHRSAVYLALKAAYPEHTFVPWLFESRPRWAWKAPGVLTDFFEWIRKDVFKKESLEFFYTVKYAELTQRLREKKVPMTVIQNYCSGSMVAALKEAYPNHPWQEWRFGKAPKGFWASLDNRKRFFAWLTLQLGISNLEEWYDVTHIQLLEFGGNSVLQSHYNSSLADALLEIYPEHQWDVDNFTTIGKAK